MLNKLEIKRQLFHIFTGILIVLLLYFEIINGYILFIIAIIGFVVSFYSRKYKIPYIRFLLKTFDRKKDINNFPGKGAVFYLLGCTISVLLFPLDIAMASIMILALGDSVSRLVGPYGYLKHPFHNEKFLEGVVAGWMAAIFGAIIFVPMLHAIIASGIAMLIEGVDLRIGEFKVDDNLTIPIISGFILFISALFSF